MRDAFSGEREFATTPLGDAVAWVGEDDPDGARGVPDQERQSRPPESLESQRSPLVTTRVGMVFLAVASFMMFSAGFAHWTGPHDSLDSLIWIAAIAVCSLGGLVSMRSVRTLRTIEQELRRPRSGGERWLSTRPVLGTDPITLGWNDLVEDARKAHRRSVGTRRPAALDHQVITLARAMRGLPIAWLITDTDGQIRFLGPAACGVLGLDESESHEGRDLPALLGLRDENDETAEVTLDHLLSEVRMVMERRAVQIGTRTIHLRVMRSRLAGRQGDGDGLAWVLFDESQQRLATNARDQFLMTATHELRTPLSNLNAYAEALQDLDGLDVEQQKKFCNVISSEANRLGRLVDHLLTVSQMEAGSMTVSRHELEVIPMLEQTIDQLQGQALQKQITVTSSLSAKLPTVFGDRDKLQAVFVNLLGNALKYTPEGGEVVVRCGAENRCVEIAVEDTGPGIPEDERERVFEKFYRGRSTADCETPGNGLGLAFAREIARLHEGDIELESTVNVGSVFTLKLPIGGQSRSGLSS